MRFPWSQNCLNTVSGMSDMDAPVSNSISTVCSFNFTAACNVIQCESFSESSSSLMSASSMCLAWWELLFFYGFPLGLLWQTALRCPFFPHLWQIIFCNRHFIARWTTLRHQWHVIVLLATLCSLALDSVSIFAWSDHGISMYWRFVLLFPNSGPILQLNFHFL